MQLNTTIQRFECQDIILTSNEIDMPGNEQGSDEI